MKVWNSVVANDEELENVLNKLEQEDKKIEKVIPYRLGQLNLQNYQNYVAEEFLIVYTEEN